METNYIEEETTGGVPIKMWTRGVPVEDAARRQLTNAARLPIVFKHIAAMPDVHFGIGAMWWKTIGRRAALVSWRFASSSTGTPRVHILIGTPPAVSCSM